jgi:tyrosyl-tRNA synthetase
MSGSLYQDLQGRGLIHQVSSPEVERQLAAGPLTGYIGFDPTADSFHVGSLLQIMTLVRFQRAGHHPIALVGGGTGLVGDPSGKEAERQMQSREEVRHRVACLRAQLEGFLEFDGPRAARLVDNAEWLDGLALIPFLRDIGKHFSVNAMVMRDSVRLRLERPDQGISFTEFTYMLLQAFDFLELHRRYGCTLQMGGSDQWGNMLSGADLIRRLEAAEAHALTTPLVTRADGKKFGKSEQGNVWLDPQRTSPYEFYQFWLNTDDQVVISYLQFFTFLDQPEIGELERAVAEAAQQRAAQRALAADVTRRVHGKAGLERATRVSEAFFGKLDWQELSKEELDEAFRHAPRTTLPRGDLGQADAGILNVLAATGLYPSKGRARKDVENGSISVNGHRRNEPTAVLGPEDLLAETYVILRRGKKTFHVVEYANASS